jgi:hypothetical protein
MSIRTIFRNPWRCLLFVFDKDKCGLILAVFLAISLRISKEGRNAGPGVYDEKPVTVEPGDSLASADARMKAGEFRRRQMHCPGLSTGD